MSSNPSGAAGLPALPNPPHPGVSHDRSQLRTWCRVGSCSCGCSPVLQLTRTGAASGSQQDTTTALSRHCACQLIWGWSHHDPCEEMLERGSGGSRICATSCSPRICSLLRLERGHVWKSRDWCHHNIPSKSLPAGLPPHQGCSSLSSAKPTQPQGFGMPAGCDAPTTWTAGGIGRWLCHWHCCPAAG